MLHVLEVHSAGSLKRLLTQHQLPCSHGRSNLQNRGRFARLLSTRHHKALLILRHCACRWWGRHRKSINFAACSTPPYPLSTRPYWTSWSRDRVCGYKLRKRTTSHATMPFQTPEGRAGPLGALISPDWPSVTRISRKARGICWSEGRQSALTQCPSPRALARCTCACRQNTLRFAILPHSLCADLHHQRLGACTMVQRTSPFPQTQ